MMILRKSAAVLLTAFFGAAMALSQTPATAVRDAGNNPAPPAGEIVGTSYADYPIARLKKSVPALEGLTPDPDQANLPHILDAVADAIAGAVPRLPDLISRETVLRSQYSPGPAVPQQLALLGGYSAGPRATTTITSQGARGQEFRYLILFHHTKDGIALEESRTDSAGKPIKPQQAASNPLGSGFAYQWLLFASANQPEFRFHYLGQQELDGRKTYVLAFAQVPERVKVPAVFQWSGKQANYYYQGILWVDQKTSQIVLVHTDLLTPLRKMQLNALTTELHFRSVRVHDFDGEFWLPSDVRMFIGQDKFDIEEVHQYSDYHLYHSTATIVPIH